MEPHPALLNYRRDAISTTQTISTTEKISTTQTISRTYNQHYTRTRKGNEHRTNNQHYTNNKHIQSELCAQSGLQSLNIQLQSELHAKPKLTHHSQHFASLTVKFGMVGCNRYQSARHNQLQSAEFGLQYQMDISYNQHRCSVPIHS